MRDHAGRVLALPNQTPGIIGRTQLSRPQVNRSVWVITRRGQRYSGAAATNRVLRELGPPWSALAHLATIPALGWSEDRCYTWIARNRRRFARWGIGPECARPGVACTPEGE